VEIQLHAFLTLVLDGGDWSASRLRPLYPQGKSPWYPLDRRLGGTRSRSGRGGEETNSQPLPGPESPIIEPVAQHLTTELSWYITPGQSLLVLIYFTLLYFTLLYVTLLGVNSFTTLYLYLQEWIYIHNEMNVRVSEVLRRPRNMFGRWTTGIRFLTGVGFFSSPYSRMLCSFPRSKTAEARLPLSNNKANEWNFSSVPTLRLHGDVS